jgi:N6-L-threonylcarbamoyladenine synthase
MGVGTVCLAGGVAANPELRQRLGDALTEAGIRLSVPPMDLCTDNAVMIAAAAHLRTTTGPFLGLEADAVPDLSW